MHNNCLSMTTSKVHTSPPRYIFEHVVFDKMHYYFKGIFPTILLPQNYKAKLCLKQHHILAPTPHDILIIIDNRCDLVTY